MSFLKTTVLLTISFLALTGCTKEVKQTSYKTTSAQEIAGIQANVSAIDTNIPELTAKHKGEMVCVYLDNMRAYDFYSRYLNEKGLSADRLQAHLRTMTEKMGSLALRVAYPTIVAGGDFDCDGQELRTINDIADLSKHFAVNDQGDRADDALIRKMHTRVLKKEVKEMLVELRTRPDSGDVQGVLSWLADDARQAKWSLNLVDVGFTPEVINKLKL